MADAPVATGLARAGSTIPPPGAVERTGSATDRRQRSPSERQTKRESDEERERREKNATNRQRRRLFDLLFDEIENLPTLDRPQKERLKHKIRARITASPSAADPVRPVPPRPVGRSVEPDHDGIVAAIVPDDPDHSMDQVEENALLAAQLRECLTMRTDAARRVAFYLTVLLGIDGAFVPHVTMDV